MQTLLAFETWGLTPTLIRAFQTIHVQGKEGRDLRLRVPAVTASPVLCRASHTLTCIRGTPKAR